MKNSEDKTIEYLDDIKLLRSNKLNINQSKQFFVGMTIELVLNTTLFKHNLDLEPFVTEIYLKHRKSDKEKFFREYLFKSRTQLAARLARIVTDEFEYSVITTICEEIETFIKLNNNIIKEKNNSQTSFNKKLSSWINVIGENDGME